jgi:hypothetical protein
MPTEKDNQFVQYLFDRTESGTVDWAPTAQDEQFVTTLQGRYEVIVTNIGSYVTLVLRDDASQILMRVNSMENSMVEQLHEFVRRQALNVDSVLDNLMREKPKS